MRSLLATLAVLSVPPTVDAAPHRPLVVVAPECPGPMCAGLAPTPHAQGRRLVWLAFDGVPLTRSQVADDATTGESAIVKQDMTVPAFALGDLENSGGLTRDQVIEYTISELESIFAPYDVEFVTERPAPGTAYSSIVFGGSCQGVAGIMGCGGIALLDCAEDMPHNITFVFTRGLDYRHLAPTAAQESAHALGLAHTLDEDDVMYPFLVPGFFSEAFGASNAGTPDEDIQQGLTCNRTSQNSHQLMLQIVGPRGQGDVIGPEIRITSHDDGDRIATGDLIVATVTDTAGVDHVELVIGDEVAGEDDAAPFELAFPGGVESGAIAVGVRAFDGEGNDSIAFVELEATGPIGCATADDCPGDMECSGGECVAPGDAGREGELGQSCDVSEECASGVCGRVGEDERCTRACTTASACPQGFECRGAPDGYCWPPADEGGCGAGGLSGLSGLPGLLILLGLGLLGTRRRR